MSTYQIRVSLIQVEDERTQVVKHSPIVATFTDYDVAIAAKEWILEAMEQYQWRIQRKNESLEHDPMES